MSTSTSFSTKTSLRPGMTGSQLARTLAVTNVTNLPGDVTSGNNTLDNMYFNQPLEVAFLSVLLVCIVVGNCIVLLAVGLSRRRHSRMHFFILHLAISDLAVGLVTVLTDLVWKITVKWYVGDAMCKLVKFAQACVMFGSTYMLVALSIDRYDAIARPLSFSTSWTRCKVLVAVAWLLSVLFASPMLFLSGVPEGTQECWMSLPEPQHWLIYFVCVMMAVLVLPAVIITACYTLILCIIVANSHLLTSTAKPRQVYTAVDSTSLIQGSGQSNGRAGTRRRVQCHVESGRSSRGIIPQAKIRTVKMTFTIVTMFIICWCPYFVFNLLALLQVVPKTREMVAVATFIQNLAPLNSAVNPLIYGIFSTRICRYLRQLKMFRVISKLFCCHGNDRTQLHSGASEFTNYTETCDTARRSPRPFPGSLPPSPGLNDIRSRLKVRNITPSSSTSTLKRADNVEMNDMIVITIKRNSNFH